MLGRVLLGRVLLGRVLLGRERRGANAGARTPGRGFARDPAYRAAGVFGVGVLS